MRFHRRQNLTLRVALCGTKTKKKASATGFLTAVLDTIDRIALNPEGYAKIIKEARKAEGEKFPYSVWFKVNGDVLVIACLHGKRGTRLAKERALGIIGIPDPS